MQEDMETTYKILKGLTRDEAYGKLLEIFGECWKDENPTLAKTKAAIDKELLPYGWSYDRVMTER